jgi:hypothetical protein
MERRGDNGAAFDHLAKALAEGMPRREALRRLGSGLAAALLASLGVKRAWGQRGGRACSSQGLSRCLEQAAALCARQRDYCLRWTGRNSLRQAQCTRQYEACGQQAAKGCSAWYGCPSGQTCQGGRCVATCEPPCGTDQFCVNGHCECPSPLATCGAHCYDPATQLCCRNDDGSSSSCPQPALCCPHRGNPDLVVCTEGTECPPPCLPSEEFCFGLCVAISTDPNNCGACDNVCPAERPNCVNGQCVGGSGQGGGGG